MDHMIKIHQQAGEISAYVVAPPTEAVSHGAVLLLHDIWGLTDHIKRVADRLADAGYHVLAPELLFTTPEKRREAEAIQTGVYAKDHRQQSESLAKFQALLTSTQTPQFESQMLSRIRTCFEYIYSQPALQQKVAAVGFGFGGAYVYSLAILEARLRAAVSFYGHPHHYHQLELRHIACPVLAFYGGKDTNAELADLQKNMAQAQVSFTPVIYDAAGASFFNDTNPLTYNAEAAADAWERLTTFLRVPH